MYLFKKKVLFFSAFMLVFGIGVMANQATAQKKADGKLYGKVVNNSSNEALAGIDVRLNNANKKATTGEQGLYAFKSLETGTYTLTVEADGYKPWRKEVKVTAEGKMLTIKLAPTKKE